MIAEIEKALKFVQQTRVDTMFGERLAFVVFIPEDSRLCDVFGMNGFLYWAKSWDDPVEEVEGYSLNVWVKPEYVKELCIGLFKIGGHIIEQ